MFSSELPVWAHVSKVAWHCEASKIFTSSVFPGHMDEYCLVSRHSDALFSFDVI